MIFVLFIVKFYDLVNVFVELALLYGVRGASFRASSTRRDFWVLELIGDLSFDRRLRIRAYRVHYFNGREYNLQDDFYFFSTGNYVS